jgi:hypothetical protein
MVEDLGDVQKQASRGSPFGPPLQHPGQGPLANINQGGYYSPDYPQPRQEQGGYYSPDYPQPVQEPLPNINQVGHPPYSWQLGQGPLPNPHLVYGQLRQGGLPEPNQGEEYGPYDQEEPY